MMVSKLNSLCARLCMHTRSRSMDVCVLAKPEVRRKQKKSCYFLVNQFLVLMQYIISKITNHIG